MDTDNFYPIEFDDAGTSFIVTNNGTAPSPCKITFIPKTDFYRLSIEGLTDKGNIIMNGIKAQDIVIIDGETRTVTINDKDAFDRYDAWEFPYLKPGMNKISIVNGIHSAISIEYNPRYI